MFNGAVMRRFGHGQFLFSFFFYFLFLLFSDFIGILFFFSFSNDEEARDKEVT